MTDSKISWTTKTWNPTTGCDQVSPGCDHCYALTLAARLKGMGNPRYQNDGNPKTSGPGFGLTLHHDKLEEPLKWRKPARVFVNSMSDLFHADVPDDFIARVFQTMSIASRHTFQVLTKRPRRMQTFLSRCGPVRFDGEPEGETWITHNGNPPSSYGGDGIIVGQSEKWPPPNVWLGTSVEDQKRADLRIPLLLETPAAVRFLSCEPLLGPVTLCETHEGHEREPDGSGYGYICLDCSTEDESVEWFTQDFPDLQWVIVGGESGPGYRPINLDWARSLRDQCLKAHVPFFFKQSSGPRPEMGKKLDGIVWKQMPDEVSA